MSNNALTTATAGSAGALRRPRRDPAQNALEANAVRAFLHQQRIRVDVSVGTIGVDESYGYKGYMKNEHIGFSKLAKGNAYHVDIRKPDSPAEFEPRKQHTFTYVNGLTRYATGTAVVADPFLRCCGKAGGPAALRTKEEDLFSEELLGAVWQLCVVLRGEARIALVTGPRSETGELPKQVIDNVVQSVAANFELKFANVHPQLARACGEILGPRRPAAQTKSAADESQPSGALSPVREEQVEDDFTAEEDSAQSDQTDARAEGQDPAVSMSVDSARVGEVMAVVSAPVAPAAAGGAFATGAAQMQTPRQMEGVHSQRLPADPSTAPLTGAGRANGGSEIVVQLSKTELDAKLEAVREQCEERVRAAEQAAKQEADTARCPPTPSGAGHRRAVEVAI